MHLRLQIRSSTVAWLACAALGVTPVRIANAEPWSYALGEEKDRQQANFCRGAEAIEAVAGVFEELGARPGFAALSKSPDCELSIETFTPVRIVKQVTLAKGTPDEYVLSFVEVKTRSGKERFLVTSRGVEP